MARRRQHGYFENKLNKNERVFFMKVTMKQYKAVREKLEAVRKDLKYFNRATLEIILNDREHAQLIAELGGSGAGVQDFYRKCKTTETKFYQLNGSAYCELLEILAEG